MTIDQLKTLKDALTNALALGLRRVKVGDVETEYQDANQMRGAIAELNGQINTLQSQQQNVSTRQSFTSFSRG